jgi:hypothetical protein
LCCSKVRRYTQRDAVMKRQMVILAFGFAALLVPFLIYPNDAEFHSQPSQSNLGVTEIPSFSSTSTDRFYLSSDQIDISRTSVSMKSTSPDEISNLYFKITSSPVPVINQLFTDSFRLMDHRNYREARHKLWTLLNFISENSPDLKSANENESVPPAYWLISWCLLNEGGKENLLNAATRFRTFASIFGSEWEDLSKAALINSIFIYAGLLDTVQGEKEQNECRKDYINALNLFLEKWPDDSHAPGISNQLENLNRSHPKP